MSHVNDHGSSSKGRWVFGLEEIPASDTGDDGTVHQVAPVSAVRRMLIDMMHFLVTEAHHPLPAW
ncbi:hypothetical protein ACWEP4_26565 [Streptomyces sp. NPDC004227]